MHGLKSVRGPFLPGVLSASETRLACRVHTPAAVAIGIEFSRSRVPDGEKRILIARLNLNIASRDTLRYCATLYLSVHVRRFIPRSIAAPISHTRFSSTAHGTDIREFFYAACSPVFKFVTARIITRGAQFCPSISLKNISVQTT